jgi:hypothetical protein
VTIYADGHTESNECCMRMWNCFIYVIKRLALIFSIVSFYIFLLFYLIFWLIAKSIYLLVLKYKTEKEENPEIQNQQPQVNTRNAININDIYIYGSQDEINNNHNGIGQQPGVQTVTINQNNNNNNYNTNRNQNVNNGNNNNYDTNGNNIYNNNNKKNKNNNNKLYINTHPKNNNNNNNNNNINNNNRTNMLTIMPDNNDQNNQNENIGPSRILPKKEEEEQIPKPSPDGEIRENIQNNAVNNDVDNKDNFETIKQSEVESNNGMDEAPAPGFEEVDKK